MQSRGIAKHFLLAGLLALAFYAAAFRLDQHLRTRRGPWEVRFQTGPDGTPSLVISQHTLGITDRKVTFIGERATNAGGTVRFDVPGQAVPFGKVKFEDLTYQPGTVTLELFGHEIELLPRTLYVNRVARPWTASTDVTLTAADKVPLPEPRPKRRR